MPLEIVIVPCLSDNYAYLAHDSQSGQTAVVDVPDAAPIIEALNARGWKADQVLLTHHHWDHVDGLPDLRAAFPDLKVTGAKSDAHRLPDLDLAVSEGDTISIGGETGSVLDVSGHTVGHIAFYLEGSKALFSADSLMALGCGRIFEGTPPMMWQSLSKMAALPPETLVYSGHEYTESNARFALTIEPGNADLISRAAQIRALREQGEPTVPATLATELATNPFLRAHHAEVKEAVGMANAPDDLVFAEVRARKDSF